MVRNTVLFFLSLFLIACSSTPSLTAIFQPQQTSVVTPADIPVGGSDGTVVKGDFWDTTPLDGDLIIIGGAGQYMKRQDGINAALQDAARKAAFYDSVGGSIQETERVGSGIFDYVNKVDTQLNPVEADLLPIIESFQFDPEQDVLEVDWSIFVRVRYPHSIPLAVKRIHVSRDARPDWVLSPPGEINGYPAAVGFANPREKVHNTYIASYEGAIFAIISTTGIQVRGDTSTYGDNQSIFSSFGMDEIGTSMSKGTLKGFYVLDTWLDPETKGVYTLAIAREAAAQ